LIKKFGARCVEERGRVERKQIAPAMMFFATVILGTPVWTKSYREMAELMRATCCFPEQCHDSIYFQRSLIFF
jgi:hypothetical protein